MELQVRPSFDGYEIDGAKANLPKTRSRFAVHKETRSLLMLADEGLYFVVVSGRREFKGREGTKLFASETTAITLNVGVYLRLLS